jgi:excisionase family DNA binding protein
MSGMQTFDERLRTLVLEMVRVEVRSVVRELMRPDEYLSPKHAAEIADVTPQTIRRWVEKKKLRRYGDGPRIVRVSRLELEAHMAKRDVANSEQLSPEELAEKMFG